MSRITEVLKNKNRIERERKQRQREELDKLNKKASYNAALSDYMGDIDLLLEENDISGVIVKIPEKFLTKFSEAIYSEDLSGYDIEQYNNKPDLFKIKLKTI